LNDPVFLDSPIKYLPPVGILLAIERFLADVPIKAMASAAHFLMQQLLPRIGWNRQTFGKEDCESRATSIASTLATSSK
jgi:hypothetical protein